MEQVDFVLSYFKNKRDGMFIDVGAYDGILISNTYKLEKEYAWTGLCVEPNPDAFKKLRANRSCFCAPNAIYDDPNRAVSYIKIEGYSEMLSGLDVDYDPRHRKRIQDEISMYGQKYTIEMVQPIRLQSLIDEYFARPNEIDYLSIDTEGSEVSVLRSIDFTKSSIALISLEDNYGDRRAEVEALLGPHGYKYLDTVGLDIFFTKGTAGEH